MSQTGIEQRKRYTVRLMAAELTTIQENARKAGLTTSEYIRRCALNKRIRSRIHLQVVGQMSRLGGLLKHLLTQIVQHPHEATLRDQLNATLNEVTSAIREVCKSAHE